jgi:phenylpropionate dioxygenase-like ring-hydroxylating dioxygenase large terminal subunit
MIKIPDYFKSEWHLVALSGDIKTGKAIARKVIGVPITIFRTKEGLAALVDRCPHRNFPLSRGRVIGNTLECPYHGWRFRADGECANVPGCSLVGLDQKAKSRLGAEPVQVAEKNGGVFVKLSPEGPEEPNPPAPFGDSSHDHFWWKQGVWKGTAFDAIENVLDPFHTKFIHNGFIRKKDDHIPVTLQVNAYERSIEMVIQQSKPDLGLMSRALEHGGREKSSTRYYAPTTVQARWEGKEELTLCVTAFFTPQDEGSFRPFACFTTPKGLAPPWLKQAAIRLFLFLVIEQDKRALARQYEVAQAFNAPRYTHGPGDILGSRVHKLYTNNSLVPGRDEPVNAEL